MPGALPSGSKTDGDKEPIADEDFFEPSNLNPLSHEAHLVGSGNLSAVMLVVSWRGRLLAEHARRAHHDPQRDHLGWLLQGQVLGAGGKGKRGDWPSRCAVLLGGLAGLHHLERQVHEPPGHDQDEAIAEPK